MLLIHEARSVVLQLVRHSERVDPWLKGLLAQRPKNVAAVTLAKKSARIAMGAVGTRA